jgi:hypothetical protein
MPVKQGIHLFIIFLLTLLHPNAALGQYNPFQSILEFDEHLKGTVADDTTVVPVVFVYTHGLRTLRAGLLLDRFPQLDIPADDTIHFDYPVMEGCRDTLAAIWYLRNTAGRQRHLLSLMLIGVKNDSSFTYYIDRNSDFNFDDNGNPVIFLPGEMDRLIAVKDREGNDFSFILINPSSAGITSSPTNKLIRDSIHLAEVHQYDSSWIADSRKLACIIRCALSLGPGKASLGFSPALEKNVHYINYEANIFSSLLMQLDIGLSYRHLSAGIATGMEMLMYSKDHLYITQTYPSGTTGTRWIVSGNWPSSKFHYGAFAEYDIRLSPEFRLAPYIEYFRYVVTSQDVFSKIEGKPVSSYLKNPYSIVFGARIKFVTGALSAVNIGVSYRVSHFDISGYFTDIDTSTYTSYFRQVNLSIAIQQRLRGKSRTDANI